MKGSLHGGPSRVSSHLDDHPTAYEKFVMHKYIKAKNTLKIYFSTDFPIFIPYFSKRLILDKEEYILSLK